MSNEDVDKMQLYSGIAAGGVVGGAALAVRATSPIYKKDKKSKDVSKAKDASVANEVVTSRREAHRNNMKTSRMNDVDKAYASAVTEQNARSMDVIHGEALAHNQAYNDVKNIWGNQQADDIMYDRNRNDYMNNQISQARRRSLDAPGRASSVIQMGEPQIMSPMRKMSGTKDSVNFKRNMRGKAGNLINVMDAVL